MKLSLTTLVLFAACVLAIPKGGGGGGKGGGGGGGSRSGGTTGGTSGGSSGVARGTTVGGVYYPYYYGVTPYYFGWGYCAYCGGYSYWNTPQCYTNTTIVGIGGAAYQCSEIGKCTSSNSTTITSTQGVTVSCNSLIGKPVYSATRVEDDDDGLSGTTIAIIVVVVIAVVGCAIWGGFVYMKKRNTKKAQQPATYAAVTPAANPYGDNYVAAADVPPPDKPVGSDMASWLNAPGEESDRAIAYQQQFPPPEYGSPLPHELSEIAAKGLDAFAFVSLDPSWVVVDGDSVRFMGPILNADASVLSYMPLADPAGVSNQVPPAYGSPEFGSNWQYFEVTIVELIYSPKTTVVSVGFATAQYPPFRLVGWNRYSVGYHSDDGKVFENDYYGGRPFASPYTQGQTVGCGYDPTSGAVYFTLDGVLVGEATQNRAFRPYHAAVGADGGCLLHVNFGKTPFKFAGANRPVYAPAQPVYAPPSTNPPAADTNAYQHHPLAVPQNMYQPPSTPPPPASPNVSVQPQPPRA